MSKLMGKVGGCLIAVVLLIASAGCQAPQAPPAAPDYAAELRPAFDTFIGVWNSKDYDELDGVMAADFRRIAPDQDADGPDAMKEFMAQAHTTYPDFRITIEEAYFLKNVAITVWTVTGTNTGEGAFPPTGKNINVTGMTRLSFADGKIVEERVFYDTATVTEQLGLAAVPHVTQ